MTNTKPHTTPYSPMGPGTRVLTEDGVGYVARTDGETATVRYPYPTDRIVGTYLLRDVVAV